MVFRSENSSKQEEHWFATNPQQSSTSTRLFVDYKAKKGLFGSSGVTCVTQAVWLPSINSCLNQKTSSSTGLKIAHDAEATTAFDISRYGAFGDVFSQMRSPKWRLSPVIIRCLLLGQGRQSRHRDRGPLNIDTFRLAFPCGPISVWHSPFLPIFWGSCCKGHFFSKPHGDFVHRAKIHQQTVVPALIWWDPLGITRNGVARMIIISIIKRLWAAVHFRGRKEKKNLMVLM